MLHDITFRVRALVRSEAMEADLEDELKSEFEQEVEALIQQGLPLEEARRQARLSFGSLDQIKEQCREVHGVLWLQTTWQDLVYAARLLKKNPVFSAIVVLGLAIGIGSNAATLSLSHALTHPLPANHPNELAIVTLGFSKPGLEQYTFGVTQNTADHLATWQHSFSSISRWSFASFNMEDDQGALTHYVNGAGVSGGMELLGIAPKLGRMLSAHDDFPRRPGGRWAVVLGHRFWQERFHEDRNVLGRNIMVSGEPATIVGVAPQGFSGLLVGEPITVYMPMRLAAHWAKGDERKFAVLLFGRLRPGITQAMAASDLAAFPGPMDLSTFSFLGLTASAGPYLKVSPGLSGFVPGSGPGSRRMMLLLDALVGIVFLLCGINVAGLVLGRRHLREHEFSVRSVLGGTRRRFYQQYLTEGLLLAVMTIPPALLAAWSTAFLIRRFLTFDSPGPMRFHTDSSLFPITLLLALLAILVFGIIPGLYTRRSIENFFRRRSPNANTYLRTAFVILQVALSLLLLNSAALFGYSLLRLRAQPLGFDPRHVIIQTAIFQDLPISKDAVVRLYQTMADELMQAPGMESVTFTWQTPVFIFGASSTFTFTSSAGESAEHKRQALVYNYVGPHYFQTLAMAVKEGREFGPDDHDQRVCIVNQLVADFFFPKQNPIGQFLQRSKDEAASSNDLRATIRRRDPAPEKCRIVGVVENAKYASLWQGAPPTIYFPICRDLQDLESQVFLLRGRSEAEVIAAFRTALSRQAPQAPLNTFLPLQTQIEESIWAERLFTSLSTILCAVSLFLTALGFYSLVNARARVRRKELALRLTMGAQRRNLLCMVLREAGLLVLPGILLGTAATVALRRYVSTWLPDTPLDYVDPVRRLLQSISLPALAVPLFILLLVFLWAAFIPASRAASIDPALLLRTE